MSLQTSARARSIKQSPTIATAALADQLRSEGRDVISLGQGAPDFDTPEHIKTAAIEAIRRGETGYTAVDGIPSLKEAIARKFSRDNQLDFSPGEIIVSSGAKHTCYNVCQAVLSPGDEAIVIAPYWVSYPAFVELAGATPVLVPTTLESGFKVTPDQLAEAITPRTRLVFFNSPSNPTGSAYSLGELQALAQVFAGRPDVAVATDDMYEHIYWAEFPFTTLLQAAPELREQVVTINGVSKAYAMTGWRIGYCAGPSHLVDAMRKIQSQSTSNPCSISQHAAVAALDGDQQVVARMTNEFRRRHDYVVETLNGMPGVECRAGEGTFYAFPRVKGAIESLGLADDRDFATHLLHTAGVAVVPGSAFGAPDYVRISFACEQDTLKRALERIQSALSGRAEA